MRGDNSLYWGDGDGGQTYLEEETLEEVFSFVYLYIDVLFPTGIDTQNYTRPSVNYKKDWLGQLYLIPRLVWSGKGYHLWK